MVPSSFYRGIMRGGQLTGQGGTIMNGTERERATDRGARSLSPLMDITGDLFRDALNLVRCEIRMATAEMSHKFTKAKTNSMLFIMGAFVLYAGFLFVLAAAVIWLSLLMPVSWSAFIVGVVTSIVGGIALIIARKRVHADVLPCETVQTAKEDMRWMRDRIT